MENVETDIGLIGLGVMGSSLALNMESNGFSVSVHNRTSPQIHNLVNNRSSNNKLYGFESLDEFVKSIKKPRKIMLMVVAGTVVDDYIQKLVPLLDQGDIIIDGGNSHYPDSSRSIWNCNRCAHPAGAGPASDDLRLAAGKDIEIP